MFNSFATYFNIYYGISPIGAIFDKNILLDDFFGLDFLKIFFLIHSAAEIIHHHSYNLASLVYDICCL